MEQFKYFPHTADDLQEMLKVVGVGSLRDLFADVPESVRLGDGYEDFPDAWSVFNSL